MYIYIIYTGSIDSPLVCSSPALYPELSNLHMSGWPSSSSMPTQTSAVAISENLKRSLESKPNLFILRIIALSKVRNLGFDSDESISYPSGQTIQTIFPIWSWWNHPSKSISISLLLGARRPQQIWCHHKSARCPGARPPWPMGPAIKQLAWRNWLFQWYYR